MKGRNFISDGYTQGGYISAVPYLIPQPVRFKYRPALVQERDEIFGEFSKRELKISRRMTTAKMATLIKEWDIVDEKNCKIAISAENISNLQSNLFDALENIVFGFRPSDTDPEWSKEVSDNEADLYIASLQSGQDLGRTRDEATVKN